MFDFFVLKWIKMGKELKNLIMILFKKKLVGIIRYGKCNEGFDFKFNKYF